MRKVYTYRSIAALDTHPCFQDLARFPHITATGDLFRAMKRSYPQITALEDIHVLQKALIANWESPDIAFQQVINTSRMIRLLPISQEEEAIHRSFIKNKVPVLNAIRLLVEADVTPDDLTPTNMEECLFKRIWQTLESEDESFGELRTSLAGYLEDPVSFRHALLHAAPALNSDTIVLHGFYFITPIQERLFDMMEKCGIQLIFLCCIDDQVPEVGKIWDDVLSVQNKFAPKAAWISDAPISMPNQPFGSVFGNSPTLCRLPHITITKYESEIDFVRDVGRLIDNEYTIYSADMNASDELLKEFYPDIYKRRHLLSYPVGQFIYHLHAMWSSKDQSLVLSITDIQACFASGWVELDGKNGLGYVAHLEGLKTYVSDCKTVLDWEARLDFLQKTKDTVLSAFEAHMKDMPGENKRWHRMMADPFLNLSCFNYDTHTLQELIDLIRHLIHIARMLFNESGEISISEHLSKLRHILASSKDERHILKEEQVIIDELVSRLNDRDLGIRKCLPGEISDAIMIIIGGGILDEDTFSFQSGKDESLVKPLYQIESAPITGTGKVHLCFADENRLPGKVKPYVWPIHEVFLDKLNIPKEERRYQYLKDMRFVVNSLPLANRYLFFSLLQNAEVEISWIEVQDDKSVAVSPYAQILEKLFHVPVKTYEKEAWTTDMVKAIEAADCENQFNVDLSLDAALESRLDMVLCPWRYIYSYVLSELPSYSSSFHCNFVLSNLIGAIIQVSGFSKNRVCDEVLELFPYLRSIEKQQIKDYVPNLKDSDSDPFDDASYPRARLYPHFLTRKMLHEAETALEEQLQKSGVCVADLTNVGLYRMCMFCPFNATCPHGKHDPREID